MKNNENLKKYTKEVQEKIINTLKAFDECHVERLGSEYKVCTGWCIKASYGDEEVLDTFKKEDIFTDDELIINYVESFHDYPIQYKGKRDYRMLNEVDKNWDAKFGFDPDGNIIRVA